MFKGFTEYHNKVRKKYINQAKVQPENLLLSSLAFFYDTDSRPISKITDTKFLYDVNLNYVTRTCYMMSL